MIYLVNDTETVGLHPPALPGSGVVEVAWATIDPVTLEITDEFCARVNPGCLIDPRASEVHGIYDADVADCPPLSEVFAPKGPTVSIGHNCITGDHEVLTEQGWKALADLADPTVKAATWSDGKVEFSECLVVRKDYSGPMLEWSTEFHKGIYTPEHTFVYTKTSALLAGGTPKWETLPAEAYAKLGPNSLAIPSAGVYESEGTVNLTALEARIVEMVRADGNIEPVSIRLKFSKGRKIARAKALLDAAGIPYSENLANNDSTRLSILACDFRNRLRTLLTPVKAYGPWVLDLSTEARAAIVDESRYWDGSTSDGVNKQTTVHSTVEADLDWLQTLAVLSGKGARRFAMVPQYKGFSTGRPIGRVNLRTRGHVKTLQHPSTVQHTGKVYCLTTPTGAFLVRRAGVVWVTGNCSFDIKFLAPHYENLVGSLCTLSLARQYIKGSENHKLGTLVKHLGLKGGPAHSALGDVHSTVQLLRVLVDMAGRDLQTLVAAARKPKQIHSMPFGSHKGKPLMELPTAYVEWFLEREIDQDLRLSLETVIRVRKG